MKKEEFYKCSYDENYLPKNIYFKTAKHSGGLKECLLTEQDLDPHIASILILSGVYKHYAYDERIHAHRYILKRLDKCLGLPTWIHEYNKEGVK